MDYSKMSKAQILKKYGSWYKTNYGKSEYDFLKGQDTMTVRSIIAGIDPEPAKKYTGGLVAKTYVNPVTVVNHLKK